MHARDQDDIAVRTQPRAALRGAQISRTDRVIFSPQQTVFVLLSFEGPDEYSQVGGLGVRVKGLSSTLAQLGYETHLFFCGDPDLPGEESHEAGRLHYRRWCQWISARHRTGVYEGEDEKIRYGPCRRPLTLLTGVTPPERAPGRSGVLMGEEWHTASSMNLISD